MSKKDKKQEKKKAELAKAAEIEKKRDAPMSIGSMASLQLQSINGASVAAAQTDYTAQVLSGGFGVLQAATPGLVALASGKKEKDKDKKEKKKEEPVVVVQAPQAQKTPVQPSPAVQSGASAPLLAGSAWTLEKIVITGALVYAGYKLLVEKKAA